MSVIRSLDDENSLYLWPPSHTGGPLGLDPFLRQPMLDSVINLISVNNGVAMTGSTTNLFTLRLTGNLSYDGSGLNLSVYDYLNTATWESILAGNDMVYGTSVRDEMSAGAGFDTIFGGDGDDSILGGLNGDLISAR